MGNCCVGAVRYQIYPPEPDTHISLGPLPQSPSSVLCGTHLMAGPSTLQGGCSQCPLRKGTIIVATIVKIA